MPITKHHNTNLCPSLPALKDLYQNAEENMEQVCFINERRQRQRQPQQFHQSMPYFLPKEKILAFHQVQEIKAPTA